MSFQVSPDSVQAAAQNLANIHSTLQDASSSVAAPTTAVAASAEDEVSARVAALFNSFGQEYQVLSVEAQAFHAQFVAQLSAGAGAYLSTEIANAQQNLANAVGAPSQGLLGAAAGAGGTASAISSAMGAVQPAAFPILGGPGGGTVGTFASGLGGGTPVGSFLGGPWGATGSPLPGGLGGGTPAGSLLGGLGGGSLVSSLNGVVSALENGSAYSMLTGPIGAGLQNLYRSIAALPGTLQSLGGGLAPGLLHAGASTGSTGGPYQTLFEGSIANLQTLGTGISANPAPFLHQIVTSTTGYANTIAGDLQNFPTLLAASPTNIQAGLQGLPAAFQSAGHQLITGAIGGALSDVTGGFPGLFVNGVDVTATGDVFTPAGVNAGVGLTGASADLNPIPTLPVLRAQYLTNLLPPGSVAAHVSQNVTNALTDTSLTARALVPIAPAVRPPFLVVNAPFNATAGLPTALGINALGGPINALDTTSAGLAQFGGQVQTGDPLGVITTLADSPAYIANAFLNGQSALPLT